MKLGLIDVGGGMRGTYATGILEVCQENNIKFDCCIGVSAGSLNLINFLAEQAKRNFRYYFTYAFRKEYCGIGCWLKDRSYLNLKYIYETLANSGGEDPLDYDALRKNNSDFFIVAGESVSGKTKYFTKDDIKKDNYRVLSASCNIPVLNKPVTIDGIGYYDGGFADPVPIKKAIEEGCEKIVLILTRPVDIPRNPKRDKFLARLLKKKYPVAAEMLANRAELYNKSIEFAKKLQENGKVLILAPLEVYGLDTLTRNKEAMMKLYEDGKKAGKKVIEWVKNTHNEKSKV